MRVLLELREMAALGFRAALVARLGSPIAERAMAAGIEAHTLPDFHKLNPAAWLRMRRLLAELRPAALNTHSSEDSWLAAPLARALGVPLVLRTRHVSAPVSSTFSYRFPHEILACSGAIARGLAKRGIAPGRVTVIPTGNDERRFRFSADTRRETRGRYGLSGDDLVIGNVGFLRDYKGHAFILDTLAALTAGGGQWRALFVGDGDLRGELEAQARRLGLAERVIFAGHQERPEDFYHAFDLFFFASFAAEGVSQALVQALLNGLPVLACDLASNAEVLEGVAASRLVPYGDIPAAAHALAELAVPPRRDDPAAAKAMAARHEAIAARYGLPAMIRRILTVYARYGITPP